MYRGNSLLRGKCRRIRFFGSFDWTTFEGIFVFWCVLLLPCLQKQMNCGTNSFEVLLTRVTFLLFCYTHNPHPTPSTRQQIAKRLYIPSALSTSSTLSVNVFSCRATSIVCHLLSSRFEPAVMDVNPSP